MSTANSDLSLDFTTLVLSLRQSALLLLGAAESDDGVDVPVDLAGARYQIDILALLESKTRGNLSDDEGRLLETVLYELRVAFVEASEGEAS